ncbi:hypothetical protein BSL78_24426 [Apostichopus japonicus]|uniref:Uncharacterized protein n=1 Tax=Stichopus japonicus TaxID=307972 RepID=A0A2G8JSK0_STIJA|nr:hypothetical protein BSL78_24426 [Apostichopus japonicus]
MALRGSAVCPVCREPLSAADNQVSDTGRQTEEDASKFVVDSKLRAWQKKMAALKVKQAKRGGIIDVVANSNKYLLDISSTPSSSLFTILISANLEENRETEEKGFQIDQRRSSSQERRPEQPRNLGGMERNGRQGQDRPPSVSRRGQTRDGGNFCWKGNHIREEVGEGMGGMAEIKDPIQGREPWSKHARGKREIEVEEEEEEEEEGFNFYGIKEEGVAEKASDGERSARREECGIPSGLVGVTVPPSRLPSSSVAVVRDGHGEIRVKSEADKTKPVVGVERDPQGGSRESDGHKRRPANQYSDRNGEREGPGYGRSERNSKWQKKRIQTVQE